MTHRTFAALVAAVLVASSVSISPAAAAPRTPNPHASASTLPPDSISSNVDLGGYAVNGTVRAVVVDGSTGNTYLGGNFTRVGLRTGTVAIAEPPDVSDGTSLAGPEVLGTVVAVYGDDRPDDPGFLIVGLITAINGVAVSQKPAYRIHLVSGAWVLDTSWSVTGNCQTGNSMFPLQVTWIETPDALIAGGLAGPGSMGNSPTGLTVIDRATGRMRVVGGTACSAADTILPDTPGLTGLSGCAAQIYCYAAVGRMAFDPTSNRLLVSYHYVTGSPASETDWENLVGYDLGAASNARAWTRALHTGSIASVGVATTTIESGSLPNAFLVRGRFPLDGTISDSEVSRTLLVNASNGSIVQRWSQAGELDPMTGDVVGPGSACETAEPAPSQLALARDGTDAWGWLGSGDNLCHFGLSSGHLISSTVGSVSLPWTAGRRFPSAPFHAASGHDYLVGSDAAVDLTTSTLTSWNLDPAMEPSAQVPSVAVAGGSIVVGGDFRFVGGRSAPGLVAFDASLAPIEAFSSPLTLGDVNTGVTALGISQGRLLVGGTFLGDSPDDSLLAVDVLTGARDPWEPAAHHPTIVDTILVAPDGGFWAGGASDWTDPAVALQHYAALDAGGGLLDAPAFGCLDAPVLEAGVMAPVCGPDDTGGTRVGAVALDDTGDLIVAGTFGSVDGITRRGLAMLTADGSVGGWNPDLLGQLPIPAGSGLYDLTTHGIVILGDRVVLGGGYAAIAPYSYGGFHIDPISSLVAFSLTSGALVRPTDADRIPWYPVGSWEPIWALAHTDAGLAAAFGQPGMAIFDATTLDFDATASAAFFDASWLATTTDAGVFALAMPSIPPAAGGTAATTNRIQSSATAATAQQLVLGGVIPRWKNRVAGNVVRTTVGADLVPPTVSPPRAVLAAIRTVATTGVPARIVWTGADLHGSGVARYVLQRSVNGGAWTTLSSSLRSPSLELSLTPGVSYRFRTKAVDYAGNAGTSWVMSAPYTPQIVQQTSSSIRYSTGWATVSNASYLGGTAKGRSIIGAAASFTFTGRAVGLVSALGAIRGKVKIYVDGTYVRTVDTYSAKSRYRALVFSWGWSTSGGHTIRLVVAGPSGRSRIDVDAFVVLR